MENLEDLNDTDFGTLVRSLFYSQCPEGSLRVTYKSLKDEFDRVNENREEGLKKRREASAKANAMKAKTSPEVAQWAPSQLPLNARTQTQTQDIGYKIEDTNEGNNMVVEDLIEYIPDTKLSREELIQKSQLIFQ